MAFTYNETNNKFAAEIWNSPTAGPGGAKGPITVTQDGVIEDTFLTALSLNGGIYALTVNGQISGAFNYGVSFGSSPAAGVNNLTVGDSGNIYGTHGVDSQKSLVVTNSGTIGGNTYGIYVNYSLTDTLNVVNKGTIWTAIPSENNAILNDAIGGGSVTNSGSILGNVNFHGGTVKVTNSTTGIITGSVLGGLSSTVTNAGLINRDVRTFNGNDVVTNSGTIGGSVDLGANNNMFTNSGTVRGNSFGTAVAFESGNDTMINSGTILGGQVSLGNGTNSLTNKGTINGEVVGGSGIDKIANSGTLVGSVILNDGANSLNNSGTIGEDTITFFVIGGVGVDTITNSKDIIGTVTTGEGNDVVKNSGLIWYGTFLGAGDDSYTGGNFLDLVTDEDGKDVYALGAGNDRFVLGSGVIDGVGDKVDGGSNTSVDFGIGLFGDEYDASASSIAVYINADSVAKTSLDDVLIPIGTPLAKGTATGTDAGLDFISNFETFRGSSAIDIIFGDAKANGIFGNAGQDRLHGGGGNDWIDGGLNNDRIYGDAGADTLTGGSGFDNYTYTKLSDSTVGKSGRDIIADFADGEDQFDFRKINPLSNVHLNSVDFTDAGFDGTAGAVRMLYNAEGWLVQLDSNGDKKVDMSIQVNDANHAIVWDASDFIFT